MNAKPLTLFCSIFIVFAISGAHAQALTVHPSNPRYFTDGSGKAIYLTGSHVHFGLVDHSESPPFDYSGYLKFLRGHNHNFIRLWTWEHAWVPQPHNRWLEFEPLPYERTGPGLASDGKPKFDLTKFNQAYFDRLRSRVMAAGGLGIYVSVMLFEGWSISGFDAKAGDGSPFKAWDGHPFNANNNINQIDGDSNKDRIGFEVHTLSNPAITAVQQAYIRKVIDTLNDLDNVLYEISNESRKESLEWQYHMIDYIREYEKTKPKQHPVVMTFLWDGPSDHGTGDNAELFASAADAISPGRGPQGEYAGDPPAADGSKVLIIDTDHLGSLAESSARWVWKSFLRGLNPIYMDNYTERYPSPERELARRNMGYVRSYADRVDLAATIPRPDLCSSAFCLVKPGFDYLVYVFSSSEQAWPSVNVDLSAASGDLRVEWFNPIVNETATGEKISGGAPLDFTAPFAGDAVLYISKEQ
jgi:Family of unknown function (DUF6298)